MLPYAGIVLAVASGIMTNLNFASGQVHPFDELDADALARVAGGGAADYNWGNIGMAAVGGITAGGAAGSMFGMPHVGAIGGGLLFGGGEFYRQYRERNPAQPAAPAAPAAPAVEPAAAQPFHERMPKAVWV